MRRRRAAPARVRARRRCTRAAEAPPRPRPTALRTDCGDRGLAYGAAVWLFADELAVPALGFAPRRSPMATHVRALFAHLAYGAALDLVIRLRRAARGRP